MLKWNMTENFSLKVLKNEVLICGFSLYVCFTSLKIVYHFFTVGGNIQGFNFNYFCIFKKVISLS